MSTWRTKIFLLIAAGAVFLLSVPIIYSAFNLKRRPEFMKTGGMGALGAALGSGCA